MPSNRRDMELYSIGGGNVEGGDIGDGGLYWEAEEYCGTIYRHQAYPGPLPGFGEIPRGKGGESVVG